MDKPNRDLRRKSTTDTAMTLNKVVRDGLTAGDV